MHVYRLEFQSTGTGPYISIEQHPIIRDMIFHHCKDSDKFNMNRPDVHEDVRFFRPNCDVCGCETIDQLQYWFKGYLEDLLKIPDMVIAEYNISKRDVKFSRSGLQIAFPKDNAMCTKKSKRVEDFIYYRT